jgi:SAM-dependent methyltransferase
MNELVQQTVLAAIDQLPTERGVRILEIGAGTGGTTAQLLPHLPAAQTEYIFTDIGARFTMQAQEKFAAYDFVAYQKLDIEQSPVGQGFGRQQYDIVIAANVLHATRNLHETLNHVQQLLAPGGLLVLLEATARRRWIDLTFGLTDGWWRFADGRSGHPLLTVDQWQQRLLESGFQSVSVLPNEPNLDTLLGQSLIIAQGSDMFTSQDRPWLILADEMGVGAEMAEKLRLRGEPSIVVYADHEYQTVNEQIFHIRLDVAEDYRRLLAALPAVAGVIHLWSLDAPIIENAEDLEVTVRRGSGSVLYLLQALLQHPSAVELPRFCLVTQGAQAVCDDDVLSGFAQAGLWGMGRVIALEHPELRCVCIDMGVGSTVVEQAVALGAEIMSESPFRPREEQVALRNGRRYVARLMRCPQPTAIGVPKGPFRLETGEHGTLDSLQLCAVERKAPSCRDFLRVVYFSSSLGNERPFAVFQS